MHGDKIMEIQIIKDKTNPLLKRREISVSVKNKTTASRIELKNKLAAQLNSKPELIVIEHLGTIYGKQEMMAKACLYQTEERLKQLSHQHLIARDAPKVVEGEAQAPASEAPKSPA
jgi:small subunit ribosomal protein S24e